MGIMLAVFIEVEIFSLCRDMFMTVEIGRHIAVLIFLRNVLLMLSFPQLLFCFNGVIILDISSGDVGLKYMLLCTDLC